MTKILVIVLVIGSLFSGAKDEYSRQICLAMKVAQTSYLVALNAINQCLASQTRTYAGSIKHVYFKKILKKKQIMQILKHQFTDFVRGQIIKFPTWLTLCNVLLWDKDKNTTSTINC